MTNDEITKSTVMIEMVPVDPSAAKVRSLYGNAKAKYLLKFLKTIEYIAVLKNGKRYSIRPEVAALMPELEMIDLHTSGSALRAKEYVSNFDILFGENTNSKYLNEFISIAEKNKTQLFSKDAFSLDAFTSRDYQEEKNIIKAKSIPVSIAAEDDSLMFSFENSPEDECLFFVRKFCDKNNLEMVDLEVFNEGEFVDEAVSVKASVVSDILFVPAEEKRIDISMLIEQKSLSLQR